MRVFIAGASGAIGRELIPRLIAAADDVIGMTRSERGAEAVVAAGGRAVIADALDSRAVRAAILRERPDVVVEQLTALPRHYSPEDMRRASEANRRIRVEGGANIQRASEEAGVARYVAQSGCYFLAPGSGLAHDDTPFDHNLPASIVSGMESLEAVEQRVFSSSKIEGIVLRYGFFYGPGTWFWEQGDVAGQLRQQQFPVVGAGTGVYNWLHIEDAAEATVKAVHSAKPGRYNITDDQPVEVARWLPAFAAWLGAPPPPHVPEEAVPDAGILYYANKLRGASNSKARQQLGFRPRPLEWMAGRATRTA